MLTVRLFPSFVGAWFLGSNLAHEKNCIRKEKKIISISGGPERTNNGKKTRRNSYDKIRGQHLRKVIKGTRDLLPSVKKVLHLGISEKPQGDINVQITGGG